MIEALHAGGRVSAADWRKYLDQDEPATLEVRANVVRGDPIPYHFYGQIRGDAGDNFFEGPHPVHLWERAWLHLRQSKFGVEREPWSAVRFHGNNQPDR